MFDSVLDRAAAPRGRLGTGAALSLIAHAILVAGAVHLAQQPAAAETKEADVVFFAALPPPPPPPPPGGGLAKPQVEQAKPKAVQRPDTIYESKDAPKPKPPEPEQPAEEQPGGEPGGVEGGEVGGTVGGEIGGKIGGEIGGKLGNPLVPQAAPPAPLPQTQALAFGAGMTRPTRVAGRDPVYTREAREARVEGLAIVRCVIDETGALSGCAIVKGLPHMDRAILEALQTHRYTPVSFQGKPVKVNYVFNIRLQIR